MLIYIADISYEDDMRTLIDIDEQQIEKLDGLAKRQKRSRASLIRQAVGEYIKARADENAADAFGLWGDRAIDGLSYQESLRNEW